MNFYFKSKLCPKKGKESFVILMIGLKIPFRERKWKIPLLRVGQGGPEEEGGCSAGGGIGGEPRGAECCWTRRDMTPSSHPPPSTSLTATKLTNGV